MNEDLEDLSEEISNYSLFEAEFDDPSFDDWLFSLSNLYGGY